jgi:CRP/FNR family transcriptional regulator
VGANIILLLKIYQTIYFKIVNVYFCEMIPIEQLEQFHYLFDEEIINNLSQNGVLRDFITNDIIMDIGQELTHIPLLLKGNIKVLREDDNGNELLLYVLETGDTCSMSLTCCLSKAKSKIRAVADKDSSVIMIPNDKMSEWFHNNESWRNFILQSYQIRFNEMLETIDTLAFMKMDKRLFKYLTDTVKLNASKTISKTHQEVAEDLNTSRVVISRLLKQLENEQKIILSRNKIEVLDF